MLKLFETSGIKVIKLGFKKVMKNVNPLLPSAAFLYPLRTSECNWFSDVFQWYKKATLGGNGLKTMFKNTDEDYVKKGLCSKTLMKKCYKRLSLYNDCF